MLFGAEVAMVTLALIYFVVGGLRVAHRRCPAATARFILRARHCGYYTCCCCLCCRPGVMNPESAPINAGGGGGYGAAAHDAINTTEEDYPGDDAFARATGSITFLSAFDGALITVNNADKPTMADLPQHGRNARESAVAEGEDDGAADNPFTALAASSPAISAAATAHQCCTVCLERDRDTLLLPCRHLVACGPCAWQLKKRSLVCPTCRQPIKGFLKIYT
jgi:hypothetical protein